jgi:hypothetical protein
VLFFTAGYIECVSQVLSPEIDSGTNYHYDSKLNPQHQGDVIVLGIRSDTLRYDLFSEKGISTSKNVLRLFVEFFHRYGYWVKA